jgi:MFS family permease
MPYNIFVIIANHARQVTPIFLQDIFRKKEPALSSLTKDEVRKSLKSSVLDGASYSSMIGLTQNYTTPYALAMNASTTQVGFLTGFPNIFMVLTQLISPTLAERVGSRKQFILAVGFMHGLMWLPIILIPYLFPVHAVWYLILCIAMLTAFDAMGNAPWNSWMADLVPLEVRGRYFSSRSRICNLVALILSFVGGGILQIFSKNGFTGFTIILIGAMFSRWLSVYYLAQMSEPALAVSKTQPLSIWKLSRTIGNTNIGKFILFNALLAFTVNVASPFFSVYMLRDLKLNYLNYVIVVSLPTLGMLIFMPFWGRLIDRVGTVKIMKVSALFVPIMPFMWLLGTSVPYLCLIQMIGGFSWAGFNLAISLFLYYAAPLENRTRYIALYNALMFGGVAIGSLLGGVIAPLVPSLWGNALFTIFLISGVARILVIAVFMPGVKEVRQLPQTSVREMISGSIKSYSNNISGSRIFNSFNKTDKKH